MKVFRYEHPRNLEGPWSRLNYGQHESVLRGGELPSVFECGETEFERSIVFSWTDQGVAVCGVRTFRDLVKWFSYRNIQDMERNAEMSLAIYEVPDDGVIVGRHQVVFSRRNNEARLVARYCLSDKVDARKWERYYHGNSRRNFL